MKFLVTGAAGFVGSNLTEKLLELGHTVAIIDNLSTGRMENIEYLINHPNLSSIAIRSIEEPLPDPEPDFDVIFHLAALARIQPSFGHPRASYDVNSTGTLNVLEYAKEHKIKIIYAGSSSVYHDIYANPYTYTKQLGEQHCLLYNKLYGVKAVIARFFNVYGPHQVTEGAYATAMGVFQKQKLENKPLTITGDGLQRRDFTHVYDIVDGLIKISECEDERIWKTAIFNFGRGENHSIIEIAKWFQQPYVFIPKQRGEAQDTLADITHTKEVLGYNPQHNVEDYIKEWLLQPT